MDCIEFLTRLDGLRMGELNRLESRHAAEHLRMCRTCSTALGAVQGLAAELNLLRVTAPGDIRLRVLEATADRYAAIETDLGKLWVGFSVRGITMVDPGGSGAPEFEDRYLRRRGRRAFRGKLPNRYERAVRSAVAGKAPKAAGVDLSGLTEFEQAILAALLRIPRGEVRPYSWLAREAGNPEAIRAVGNTMAHNPVPLLLPCHRVVPVGGGVGNYAFGPALKRELLAREGAPVDVIEACGREGTRYVGSKTTGIFCFPTCHDARRVLPRHRIKFKGVAEAASGGFRPCRHCRP